MPIGSGGILCSQWLLTQRFDVEPLAGVLLQRLFDYCFNPVGHCCAAGRAGHGIQFTGGREIGFTRLIREMSQAASPTVTRRFTRCWCWPAATPFGRKPPCSSRTSPALLTAAANSCCIGPIAPLSLRPNRSCFPSWTPPTPRLALVLRRDVTNPASDSPATNLYWIDQAGDWNQPEIISTNVACPLLSQAVSTCPATAPSRSRACPLIQTGMQIPVGWWLWSNGEGLPGHPPSRSPARISLMSRPKGTPVAGGWPQMSLKIVAAPRTRSAFDESARLLHLERRPGSGDAPARHLVRPTMRTLRPRPELVPRSNPLGP